MAEKLTLARPYAKAAFEYADSHNELALWNEVLQSLSCLVSNSDVAEFITMPQITSEQVFDLMTQLLPETITPAMKNLIHLLASYHRLSLAKEIAELFALYVAEREKTIDVEVISAQPLSESMQAKLSQALEKRLSLGVFLKCRVEPELIGGAIIHAGDYVIDSSVRNQLAKLQESLISS